MKPEGDPQPVARFRILLLGPFLVLRDDVPLPTQQWQRWVGALLKLMATAPGRHRPKDEIVELLWPTALPAAGASNLRYVLHLLRRNLGGGEPGPLLSQRGWITLSPAYDWEVDLDTFQSLVRGAGNDRSRLEAAAVLYRGEPLLEDRYDDWATPLRTEIQHTWRALCLQLGKSYHAQSVPDVAVQWFERVLQADPLDEEAVERLVGLLAETGRTTDAMRRYRSYEQRLQRELNVLPGAQLQALVAQLTARYAPQSANGSAAVAPSTIIPTFPLSTAEPLVGRAEELAQIMACLRETGQGPRLVLIAAAAGVGKTRLLAEVAQQARWLGVLTLAGGCYEQEARLPYGPLHDALLDYLRAQPVATLRRQLQGLLPELARLVPEVRPVLGNVQLPEMPRGDQRLALFSAVGQWLERICGAGPLLLLLDDLQWADDATIQLLHFLLRQRQTRNLLVASSYRVDEIEPHGRLAQLSGAATRIELPPLTEAELARVIEQQLHGPCAPSLRTMLYETSAGNPFFALQIVALLQQEQRLEWTTAGWGLLPATSLRLPHAVRETVERRLRRLEPDDVLLLSIGAVLGREFSQTVLEALWRGDESCLVLALQHVLAAQLLCETEHGYCFQHPLVQTVAYDHIPIHLAKQLHARAGHALQAFYGAHAMEHAAELAQHFMQGNVPAQAVIYALPAGDQAAAAFAQHEAEHFYRNALQLAQQLQAREQGGSSHASSSHWEAEACFKLGTLLAMHKEQEEALPLLLRAAELYKVLGDVLMAGWAHVRIAKLYVRMGQGAEIPAGVAIIEQLLPSIQTLPPTRELTQLYEDLGTLYFRIGRYEEQLLVRERCVAVAEALGDEQLQLRAQLERATALAMLGKIQEAGRLAEATIAPAEAAGDLLTLQLALAEAAEAAMIGGNFEQSYDYRERERVATERMGFVHVHAFTLSNLAQLELYRGNWPVAQHHATDALDLLGTNHNRSFAAYALSFLGELKLRSGCWQEATRLLEEASTVATATGDFQALRYSQRILAEHDLLLHHADEARMRLDPLLDRAGLEEHDVTTLLPILAWAYLELGAIERAAECVMEGRLRATRHGHQLALIDALRVHGMVLTQQKCWAEADQAFSEAKELAGRIGYPYAQGQVLQAYGLMLRAQGEEQKARWTLEAGLAIFRRLGALRDVEAMVDELVASADDQLLSDGQQ